MLKSAKWAPRALHRHLCCLIKCVRFPGCFLLYHVAMSGPATEQPKDRNAKWPDLSDVEITGGNAQVSEQKGKADAEKGERMDAISEMVEKINSKIRSRKGILAPKITDLRAARSKHAEVWLRFIRLVTSWFVGCVAVWTRNRSWLLCSAGCAACCNTSTTPCTTTFPAEDFAGHRSTWRS